MDWLLERISNITRAYDPIITADGFTEVERAAIALEDRYFYSHAGFDVRAIARVLRQMLTLKRPGGVSTIEQQLVRTLLERRERTIRRKTREIVLAVLLSFRISKRDTLRAYLSTAYLGYRLRGVDEVAKALFGIRAPEADAHRAALIVSLLVYPVPRSVLEAGNISGALPSASVTDFFQLASSASPAWRRKVERRYNYGLSIMRKTKEPR